MLNMCVSPSRAVPVGQSELQLNFSWKSDGPREIPREFLRAILAKLPIGIEPFLGNSVL